MSGLVIFLWSLVLFLKSETISKDVGFLAHLDLFGQTKILLKHILVEKCNFLIRIVKVKLAPINSYIC